MTEECLCPSEGYSADCPMARGGLGHVKKCPDLGVPCPCLPGSISEAHCWTSNRDKQVKVVADILEGAFSVGRFAGDPRRYYEKVAERILRGVRRHERVGNDRS